MSHPTSLLSGQSRGKARLVRPHDRRRGRQGNETKPDDPALNAVPWRGYARHAFRLQRATLKTETRSATSFEIPGVLTVGDASSASS